MSQPRGLLLEAGKEIIRREHASFRDAAIDDAEHIPRIQRIAAAVADVAREASVPDEEAEALRDEMVAHGREQWLDLCVANLREEDVDLDTYREESSDIFEAIRTADDPWSVYH